MLGRSARRDPSNGCRGATNRRAACGNGKTPNCHRPKAAKRRSTTIRRRRTTSLPSHGRGGPQQARIAIANRNAAENAEQWFTANVNAVHLVRNVGRSLRGTLAGLRCGRHGSKSRTTATANRSPGPAAIVPPRQPYFVILNEVDRRTQREQRPLADYAEQGGERQTKCSQESILGKVADVSLRST